MLAQSGEEDEMLEGAAADEVDPAIYTAINDPNDPYGYKYAEFRERRERDMADPDSPRPLPLYRARHQTTGTPWGDLENLFPIDWAGLRELTPGRVEQLKGAMRLRVAFDHPDLKISQLVLGPEAVLPGHADGAPGAYIVISGRGEIRVGNESAHVTTGSTVKLEPYVVRSLEASAEEPLRLLWIRWAPGGDQAYVDAGYYLTGANQHIQPEQAKFEDDYLFWGGVDEAYGLVEAAANPAPSEAVPVYADATFGLRAAKAAFNADEPLYPGVSVFGHDSKIPWLSAETLKEGGFFFSDDLGSLLEVAEQMIQIARHKAIFRASRPDGRWDFNFSESAWGARSIYVEHSHVIPEFYYVLSGPVIYGVDGERHESMPGDILFNNSYSPHLAQGVVEGLVFRSFSSTFAPNGDRSVFERPYFMVEPLTDQAAGSVLSDSIEFH